MHRDTLRSTGVVTLGLLAACYHGSGTAGGDDAADSGDTTAGTTAGSNADTGGADTGDPAASCGPLALDMRRLTERQYRRAIEDIFDGLVTPSDQFPAPSGETPTGYSTELGAKDVSEHDVEQVVYAAEDVAVGVAAVLPDLLPCAAEPAPDDACVAQFLDRQGRRAFRRSLSADERATLLDAWSAGIADGATFAEAVALMVDAMLQSPQFLYVVEDAAASARPLEGFEIASRLSFMLWDSIPDDTLLDLAEGDALLDAETIEAQAERLLASDRADTTIARFFREWSQTRQISAADKSAEMFPEFDGDLAASMNTSFDKLVISTVRDGGTLDDLLRSSDAWVDPALAGFFDVAAQGDWAKVELDPTRYRGILTQPAFLASQAHSDRTSYVFRGAFVRKRLLCEALPPPPAGAMSVHLDLPPDPTARQESEARIARGDCAGCHQLIDPAGLAFERFDAIGRYREADALGRSIDPAGTIVGLADGDIAFADQVALVDGLADLPEVDACFARQVFRFAVSREETDADACTIAVIEDVLAQTDGDLGAAFVAIVGADDFRTREAP